MLVAIAVATLPVLLAAPTAIATRHGGAGGFVDRSSSAQVRLAREVIRGGRLPVRYAAKACMSAPSWSDDFNGPAIVAPTRSKWQACTGGTGFCDNELQFYTARASNVALDGLGHLAITARCETFTGGGNTRRYTSAKIETKGAFSTTYGSIQARIKLPAGRGLWPAFWAVGADIDRVGWPRCGEIDVMENLGQNPHRIFGSIHGPTRGAKPHAYGLTTALRTRQSLDGAFHVYGVNWSPASMEMTLDGFPYASYSRRSLSAKQRWVFKKPFYLVLNLAVGGKWPGAPDSTTQFPATMLVDWVRVYSH